MRKLSRYICLVMLSCCILLSGCSNDEREDVSENLFSFREEDIASIEIVKGNSGESVSLNDKEDIESIIEVLNTFQYCDTQEVNTDGWSIGIRVIFEDGSDSGIIVLDQEKIEYDGKEYIAAGDDFVTDEWLDQLSNLGGNR